MSKELDLFIVGMVVGCRAIVGPDDGGVDIVGELPTSILNLTNLQHL